MNAPTVPAADQEQLKASDPGLSAFVGASAGSGKTKLLIDRLLRLMLTGAAPERILCLTFTRAAAAEMALRLQRELGEWVRLADDELAGRLAGLRVPEQVGLDAARRLFATVLDLPGGMRIGTIHAFCQSLLRRFPLEASVSPHFALIEDTDSRLAREAAREAALEQADAPPELAALARLAGLCTPLKFGELVKDCGSDRDRIERVLQMPSAALLAAQLRVLGATADSVAALLSDAVEHPGFEDIALAAREVAARGSPKVQEHATRILQWLAGAHEERLDAWGVWCNLLLTKDGKPRKIVNEKLASSAPALPPVFEAESARVLAVDDAARAIEMAEISHALVSLARPALAAYADGKAARDQLDYEDLIGRTLRLLVDPGAAWVLYKLDGGLDHLLLDEVQDTSAAQWRIADALIAEFFAGDGAREGRRTAFAVGDRKQSIFSFQGAAPDQFDHWRSVWRDRVSAAQEQWRDVQLDVSFRSASPVLDLVDEVFAAPDAALGVVEPGKMKHRAHRQHAAGRVELWPLVPRESPPDTDLWSVPDRNQGLRTPQGELAEHLATWIAAEIAAGAAQPGDVMVLVRRRSAFDRALLRALKQKGVPVGGADRMMLVEQPAVADLLALCDTLLLPEDDLALATTLTSPLGGVDDDGLMDLASGRPGALWNALRDRAAERPDWRQAAAFLTTLLGRADYVTPHALLAEALGPLGGRARLLGRLGPEAAEPIDELLRAALAHAATHPPSLQSFVQWLRRSGAEVKRDQDAAPGAVRIMTVHAAKGLEARLVILPDTTALPKDDQGVCWMPDPVSGIDIPVWAPAKELRCRAAEAQRAADRERLLHEHRRLLYVALTRARDRLVVCGWQHNSDSAGSWYRLIEQGFARLPAVAEPFDGGWPGECRVHARAGTGQPAAAPVVALAPALPTWAGAAPDWRALPPPAEPVRGTSLAPSRPEGVGFGEVPPADSPLLGRDADARFRRGRLLHALLQHLPDLQEADRPAAGRRFLQRQGLGIDARQADALLAETLGVLGHPELAAAFGPGSRAEVPLTGLVGDVIVGGLVDRLAVLADRVLVIDYKTNRAAPADPASTPPAYLRQMAAYRAVLRGVFPGRRVVCALVWTRAARVGVLPDPLLDAYAPGVQRGMP